METIAINIVDSQYQSSTPNCDVTVRPRGRFVLREEGMKILSVELDDHLLFGNIGTSWFVCKKPEGYFGYRLRLEGKKSRYVVASSKSIKDMVPGDYNLGEVAIDANKIHWFPVIKI